MKSPRRIGFTANSPSPVLDRPTRTRLRKTRIGVLGVVRGGFSVLDFVDDFLVVDFFDNWPRLAGTALAICPMLVVMASRNAETSCLGSFVAEPRRHIVDNVIVNNHM